METKVSFLIVALTLCLTQFCTASTNSKWAVFKYKYGKKYDSLIEEYLRQFNWQQNHKEMERHNELYLAGKATYYMEENKYSDMSQDEFHQKMLGHVMPARTGMQSSFKNPAPEAVALPKSVDWREKGYVTDVKDQGPCGSCWAFSTTGGLEGQHFKATGKLVNLSESNLIDCTRRYGNLGCRGGLMDNAYQYIIDNGGIDTESSYPYDPSEGLCFFTEKGIGATMSAIKFIQHGNETALQEAVAMVGPVSVAINADNFRNYGGGVFNDPFCEKGKLDHAVLVVGYGHDATSGLDYWIVKNSWSDSWGMRGYIWMTRNQDNQCGIASMAMYPVV